tara:strand:+ start:244 stop:1128 length:885 start_codon:yes stop_codon:yes gene_type:complete
MSKSKGISDSNRNKSYSNKVFFKDARKMGELPNNSINLIITSPPYFNIKDYSKDGKQEVIKGDKQTGQIGDIPEYKKYISEMIKVWKECQRVLKPNGKLIINTPIMPILKKNLNTHYNRDVFNIDSDIQHSIKNKTNLFLVDIYIWNRTNPSKKLMFGSYPYPPNFYAQNTTEFITVYVKDGKPERPSKENKEASKLTQKEWTKFTKQIWDIPIPNKNDLAFGEHTAIMPEEIVERCVRLYSFVGDIVLDPFAGSGTTLRIAKKLKRDYVGYEISPTYKEVIQLKLETKIDNDK